MLDSLIQTGAKILSLSCIHDFWITNKKKRYKRNRLKQVSVYSTYLYAYVTLIYAKKRKKCVIKIIITHNRKACNTTLFNEKCCTNRQRYFFFLSSSFSVQTLSLYELSTNDNLWLIMSHEKQWRSFIVSQMKEINCCRDTVWTI